MLCARSICVARNQSPTNKFVCISIGSVLFSSAPFRSVLFGSVWFGWCIDFTKDTSQIFWFAWDWSSTRSSNSFACFFHYSLSAFQSSHFSNFFFSLSFFPLLHCWYSQQIATTAGQRGKNKYCSNIFFRDIVYIFFRTFAIWTSNLFFFSILVHRLISVSVNVSSSPSPVAVYYYSDLYLCITISPVRKIKNT